MKRDLLGPVRRKRANKGDVDEHFGHEKDTRPFWRRVNSKAGLPLWEAMLFYGDQFSAETAYCRRLEGFDNPPFYPFEEMTREEQREYNIGTMQLQRARRDLEQEIILKLIAGELFATGYSADVRLDEPAAKILPDRWRLLESNFLDSTAKGSGIEISGILVFKRDERSGKLGVSKRYSPAELRRWYSDWISTSVANGNEPSRDEELEAACKRFGVRVSRATLRALRNELAPSEWKQHGRRRQS
jgi:hypothetical protein